MKGRLLASVCALGLLAAAPTFAADSTGTSTGTPSAGSMNSSDSMHNMQGSGTAGTSSATSAENTSGNTGAGMHGSAMGATGSGNSTGMASGSSADTMHHTGANNGTTASSDATGTMHHGASNGASMHSSGYGNGTSGNGETGMHTTTHPTHHAARSSHARTTDTSQNAAVDRLNEESLRAAQQNRPFQVGSSATGQHATGMPGAASDSGAGSGSQR